jgi:phosphopantothenoylcysteine decarboxylase/phosphopantothenate--cysteine ligase
MGYAIAAEASRRGAHVVLVTGPTKLEPPIGAQVERVRSAMEMATAIAQQARGADAVVMSAAVADYMPEGGTNAGKIAKTDGPLTLKLVRTPDILADLGRTRGSARTPILVGFAAETGDPRPRARQKLAAKQVDLIVANDVSREGAGFDVETNAAWLISADGEVETPLQHKTELASVILDRLEQLLARIPAVR